MIRTLFRLSGNFPVHPDTLHNIWIFCTAKYPEIPQPIMNLSQKLSGFEKTFWSALLTRWRGFCDSEEPSPCSAKQLLFSPFFIINIMEIIFIIFTKATVIHLQQLGTSVWSHRSPCGLRKNQFWTRFVSCFTILSATTISDNTNPITSLECL